MFKVKLHKNIIIIRTLYSIHNPKIRIKPKADKRVLNSLNSFYRFELGRPAKTFDLNTRIITIEGQIGIGKKKFAEKVANHFHMTFIDDVNNTDLHVHDYGHLKIDYRKFNDFLPRKAKVYTREMMWNDDDTINKGKPLLLQLHHYYWRHYKTCKAMGYLFNTGQGMVMKRSPWSDNAMAVSLVRSGLMSEQAYKMYNLIRCESLTTLWRPHFVIYLKSSVKKTRELLNKSNNPMKNARNLTDNFFKIYDEVVETVFLESLKVCSKIFVIDMDEYDIEDDEDFEYLMDQLAALNVDYKELGNYDRLFHDWHNRTHGVQIQNYFMRHFSSVNFTFMQAFPQLRIPHCLSEGSYNEDDLEKIHAIASRMDIFTTNISGNSKYTSLKDIMFPPGLLQCNFGNPAKSPYLLMNRAFI